MTGLVRQPLGRVVVGEPLVLVCPHHGLTLDRRGACVLVTGLPSPGDMRIRNIDLQPDAPARPMPSGPMLAMRKIPMFAADPG